MKLRENLILKYAWVTKKLSWTNLSFQKGQLQVLPIDPSSGKKSYLTSKARKQTLISSKESGEWTAKQARLREKNWVIQLCIHFLNLCENITYYPFRYINVRMRANPILRYYSQKGKTFNISIILRQIGG